MDPRIARAREIVRREADALHMVGERLGQDFAVAVDKILELPGRVVAAGMGKAGIIAEKISATSR